MENSPAHAKFEKWSFDTITLHADQGVENGPDVAPPIHVTTIYKQGNEVRFGSRLRANSS